MAREGLMDDTGYEFEPYGDTTLEEIEQKGYVSGYQDGVVETCDLFIKRFCEFHQMNGHVGREHIQSIAKSVEHELQQYIWEGEK